MGTGVDGEFEAGFDVGGGDTDVTAGGADVPDSADVEAEPPALATPRTDSDPPPPQPTTVKYPAETDAARRNVRLFLECDCGIVLRFPLFDTKASRR